MLNVKFLQNLIIAYKLSPFIKRAVIIKITVAIVLYGYWSLGKAEVFRQLDKAVVEMKALDKRNDNLMARIKDVGMVNQAIQRMEFNVVDSGKVFAGATLDAELLTLVSLHAEQHNLALISLGAVPPQPAKAVSPAKSQEKLSTPKEPKKSAERIKESPYEVKVKGSFANIMAFIDALVHDRRYLRLGDMTIAAAKGEKEPWPAPAKAQEPTARLAFSVYVLRGKEAPL